MSFSAKNIGAFHYQYMLSDPDKKVDMIPEVIELYDNVEKQYRYSISFYDDSSNFAYVKDSIIEKFAELGFDMSDVCNTLVKYLFHSKQSKRKNVFWMCFGDIVHENLLHNVPDGSIQCKKCGERFVPANARQILCGNCATYQPIVSKTLRCVDCGKLFDVPGIVKNKKRCNECQKLQEKKKKAERNARYYQSRKDTLP